MTMSYQTESESEKECDSRNRQELVWTTVRVSIHWHSRGFSQVGVTKRVFHFQSNNEIYFSS